MALIHPLLHWGLRFAITYAFCWAILRRPLYAVLPAAFAVVAIKAAQALWEPLAGLTFALVSLLLRPFMALYSDPATRTLGTPHFMVQIADACSGLEGIGLMLVFCTAYLWFCRTQYRFPKVLTIVPVGVLTVYGLNVLRIAILVLIGDAGYTKAAVLGFHSLAGWVGFNVTALGVVILARHLKTA